MNQSTALVLSLGLFLASIAPAALFPQVLVVIALALALAIAF